MHLACCSGIPGRLPRHYLADRLASKDVMLERLHATLAALHKQHTEVVQVRAHPPSR